MAETSPATRSALSEAVSGARERSAASVAASISKPQPGGEAQAAQQPQRVLAEAPLRLADAADKPSGEVRAPAKGVRDAPGGVHGHGVYREVAPAQVGLEARREAHGVRPAAVGIRALGAVGRNLAVPAAIQYCDGAVARAGRHGAAEEALDLAGPGGGGDVPVAGAAAHERVAHAAADEPGLIARALERIQDVHYIFRRQILAHLVFILVLRAIMYYNHKDVSSARVISTAATAARALRSPIKGQELLWQIFRNT